MKKWLLMVLLGGCSANPAPTVEPSVAEKYGIVEQGPSETDIASHLDQACAGGEAASCLSLGIRYERGDEGVPHDHDKALELYDRACTLGNASGCYQQALMLMYDKNDPIRAHLLLEHTCKNDHGPSCVMLGDLHRDGRLLRKDEGEAVKLYKQACDTGYMNGCSAYIDLVWTASRQVTDLKGFADYMGKSCERGHAMSCEELGKLYETGTQWLGYKLDEDPEKAQALFAKAAYLRRVAGPRGFWDELKTPAPVVASGDINDVQHQQDLSKPGYVSVAGPAGTIVVDGVDTGAAVPGNVLILTLGRHEVSIKQADGKMSAQKVVFVGADQRIDLDF